MSIFKKIQSQSENTRKLIFWAIIVIVGATLLFFWAIGLKNNTENANTAEFIKKLNLPKIDTNLPDTKIPQDIQDNLEKAIEEANKANEESLQTNNQN